MNPRRIIHWDRVKGFKVKAALVIGTSGGAGLVPFAPGTAGTLVGIPIAYFTNEWELAPRIILWTFLTVIGTWAAQVFDTTMGTKDNQNLVIDETVGLGITAWTAGQHATTLFASFVLFRFFDIIKPPPVGQIDRWSKKHPQWSGFGVMADDIAAGVQAWICIALLQHFQLLP